MKYQGANSQWSDRVTLCYALHEDAEKDSASITELTLSVKVPSTWRAHALCVQVGFSLSCNTACVAVGCASLLLLHSCHSS